MPVDGGVDEVAEDRTGGGRPARAAPIEHEVTDRRALHEDGVEALAHGGQRVLDRDHGGMDPDADLTGCGLLGHRQGLHDEAHPPGERDVHLGDPADALVVDVVGGDGDSERDAGDDRRLGAGVVALHVGGGIGLGVTERLGLGQCVGVGRARLRHPREDVVGGAVDDAHHAGDALAHQRLAERPDDRDATRDGGLEEEVDAGALGRLEELRPVLGEQLLVAGDDRLARLEGGEDQVPRRLDAADELDDQVDVGVVDDRAGIIGEAIGGEGDGSPLGEVAHGDAGDVEVKAGAGGDGGPLGGDQLDERRADVAAPQHTHPDVVHRAPS